MGLGDEDGKLSFFIPLFPPSMNRFYMMIPSRSQVLLRPEIVKWKSDAKLFIPEFKVEGEPKLSLTLWFHSADWFYKNGKVRRLDSPNLEKVVIDSLFERWGLDDCLIWHKESWKVTDSERKIRVEVGLMNDCPV